jgi:type VI secretion system protein ImpA
MLMREASQEKSDRARFLRKSQAATVMVDAGLEPVAVPILEEMLEQIEKHGLEEWEAGETVAQPLGLMYRCLKQLDGDESTAESLYLRVCRLDPMQAIHFRKPNDVHAGE